MLASKQKDNIIFHLHQSRTSSNRPIPNNTFHIPQNQFDTVLNYKRGSVESLLRYGDDARSSCDCDTIGSKERKTNNRNINFLKEPSPYLKGA